MTAIHVPTAFRWTAGVVCFSLSLLLVNSSAQQACAADTAVRLVSQTPRSFELITGAYRVQYDVAESEPAWIRIVREGTQDGIATKLACGQQLDVTDGGAGEGGIYKWTDDRKDHRMFRRLTCEDLPDTVEIRLESERQWAAFDCRVTAFKRYPGLLHWTVTTTAKEDKAFSGQVEPDCFFITAGHIPAWWGDAVPHDVVRYSVQRGPGAPHVFFRSLPMASYVLYFEDLTSLNELYRLTGCATPYDYPPPGNPGAVRMGQPTHWFQMSSPDGQRVEPMHPYQDKVERYAHFGYERPESFRVPQGKSLVLADTYLYLKPAVETDTITVSRNFVEMLADVYQFISKPPVIPTDWAGEIVPQLVHDVMRPENTSQLQSHLLPRAYVAYEHEDYQLWTLLQLLHPLELYVKKFPQQQEACELRNRLNDALPLFLDRDWGGFHNSPAPIKQDMFFTSVYLFSQAVMVADLARLGNENARTMLFAFRDRLLAMGRAYDYVMAEMWLQDFSKQRNLYQADSTLCYLYVMMALYDLSGGTDTAALESAKGAARRIRERCLDVMWEANMTAAGVVACQQLYRVTHDPADRDLAFIPLASILREAWLWECDFGVGQYTTTFWSFCGCPAAPSSAEFESHRVRLHLKEYAALTRGAVAPNVTALLDDAWQRGPTQSRFSLPPILAQTGARQFMAAEGKLQTNCGELRYDQMIPLEDVRTGWGTDLEWWQNNARLGVVGQEIYGAGGPIWYALWQDELPDKAGGQ